MLSHEGDDSMTTAVAEKPGSRPKRTYTVDDVLSMTGDHIYELVDGEIVEKEVANKAAEVAFIMAMRLFDYRATHGGVVIPPEGFVRLFGSPRFLRRPDTGFIVTGRLPGDDLGDGALDIAPDLIIEVISPRDIAEKVEEKFRMYLDSGVRQIWAIYPRTKVVRIIRPGGAETRLQLTDAIDGEDILPGFRLPVTEVFTTPVPAG
jgi:Uma2 family endonuclease